jgi:hypothetical protein
MTGCSCNISIKMIFLNIPIKCMRFNDDHLKKDNCLRKCMQTVPYPRLQQGIRLWTSLIR